MNPTVIPTHASTTATLRLGNIISEVVENSASTVQNYQKMCRICLQSFSKLISLESYGLRTAYEQVTGVSVEHDDGLPRELCVECATLLDKYHRFRDKSIQADRYLKTLKIRGLLQPSQKILKKYILSLKNIYCSLSRCSLINHTDISSKDMEIKLENNQTTDIFEVDNKTNLKSVQKLENNSKFTLQSDTQSQSDIENCSFDMHSVHSDSSDEPLSSLVTTKKKTEEKNTNHRRKALKNTVAAKKTIKKELLEDKNQCNKPKEILEKCFNVKILNKEEQLKVIEDRKEKYRNNPYNCSYCFKSFTNDITLQLHLTAHNESRGASICDICHIRYDSNKKLTNHHDNVHKYQYDCLYCDVVVSSRNSAVLHAKWHKGKRYTCKDCGIVLEKLSSYLTHVRIKHPSDHICGYCGYSFLGDKGLTRHLNTRHCHRMKIPLSGPWCTACNIQFASDIALETHKGIKHTNTNRNVQIHNAKQNRNRIAITSTPPKGKVVWKAVKRDKRHDRVDSDKPQEQSILCEVCKAEVGSWHSYRVHFRRAHPTDTRTVYPDTYNARAHCMCHKCGKVYKFKSLLIEHLKCHSSSPQHQCTVCPKTFFTRKQQQAHMLVHGQADFVCPVCGKAFKHKSNRNRHYNYVHSTEKPYKCTYCDKSFKSEEQKKLHTRHLHLKEPWPKRNRTKHTLENTTLLEQSQVSAVQKCSDFNSYG